MSFPRYEKYKDSGVEWLGEIPAKWGLLRNKYLLREKKAAVGKRASKYALLSLTLQGIILRDMENPQGKFPAEFDTYKVVEPNDLVFCLFDVEETPRTVGHSTYSGMITGAYDVFEPTSTIDGQFIYYCYLALDFDKRLTPLYTGLRNVIKMNAFMDARTPVPSFDQQVAIVSFLDQKTVEIDEAIAKKQKLIALLEEQKAILINQAVTKGLNPDVPMKDSGVEWIGRVPAHWEVKRAKYLFDEIDERSKTGQEELLSVSHMTGVTPRSEKKIMMFMAEDYTGSKLCTDGDLVINIMWAWMGALGVSDQTGIVSPSYGVFRPKKGRSFNNWFLEHLLRSGEYVAEYNRRSTGLHSSRLRLYADYFFDMEIGFPSVEEQNKIEVELSERTEDIDKALAAIQKEIAAITELKATLIAHAVTGKIRI